MSNNYVAERIGLLFDLIHDNRLLSRNENSIRNLQFNSTTIMFDFSLNQPSNTNTNNTRPYTPLEEEIIIFFQTELPLQLLFQLLL